ncbi:unnamed protein product [Brachionus calyciflorus]|nr:unnamed protein product [Brachionus calyciflorus]CAF0891994.1 unnamed protein product [Brachionus calyciflorus]
MLIILFDPNNENLSNDEKLFIKSLQNKYMNLTYASLCDQFGCSSKANLVFKGMMFEVSKISDLGRWFEKTVVEKSDSEFVRPLMKEVFSFPSDHTPPSSIASSTTSSNNSVQSIGSVQIPSVQYQSTLVGDKIDIKQEAILHD